MNTQHMVQNSQVSFDADAFNFYHVHNDLIEFAYLLALTCSTTLALVSGLKSIQTIQTSRE